MEEIPKRTNKMIFQVRRRDIDYIRNTLESYDGMALVRTIDPYKALIEVYIAPGCEGLVSELIDSLRIREGIKLTRCNENE